MKIRLKNATFLIGLLLTISTLNSYGQITAVIEFNEHQFTKKIEKSRIKRTKSFLRNHQIYLVIDNEEIFVDFVKDTLFRISNLSNEQIDYLKNRKFVLIAFKKGNNCYYSLLPNAFYYYKSISGVWIYKQKNKKFRLMFKKRRYVMNISYSGVSTPLDLIPCREYNGEYDQGL